MNFGLVKSAGSPACEIHTARNSGGNSGGSFQRNFSHQLKEDFKQRVTALFDELDNDAASIVVKLDIYKFENYRRLIRELLYEVVRNAYHLNSDCVFDCRGTKRTYATVSVVDKKLEELAEALLSRSSEQISFLSRVDEIRGLIMDLLY